MSRRVFEYFFEPNEFEPHFTDLFGRLSKRSEEHTPRVSDAEPVTQANPASVIAAEETKHDQVGDSTETQHEPVGTSATNPTIAAEDSDRESVAASTNPSKVNGQTRGRVRHLVSVHALGQFVYSQRAAILATELGDTHDIDERAARLSYTPNYTLEKIDEELSKRFIELLTTVTTGAGALLLLVYSVSAQHRLLFQGAFLLLVGALLVGAWLSFDVISLVIQRRAAKNAEALQPLPSFVGTEPVNWWSMLKCGFDIVEYEKPIQHPELPLEGNPWRVLERDSLRIPVIRSGAAKLVDQRGELYAKHQIRLAAYAMLLESTRHAQVPYGIVFPRSSPDGLAMEITPALRAKTIRILEEFVQRIEDSQQRKIEPRIPDQKSRCSGCDYGKPVQITESEIKSMRKAGKELLVLRRANGQAYHCQCGDRFGSAPPHKDSIGMGLSASLDDN